MRILLATFCLCATFFTTGCAPAADTPANQARITVLNRSRTDTVGIESLADTTRILPGHKLDLHFKTNGLHRVQLMLPRDTITCSIHIETQAHHSYVNYPSLIDAP